jgi:hypothetical protein
MGSASLTCTFDSASAKACSILAASPAAGYSTALPHATVTEMIYARINLNAVGMTHVGIARIFVDGAFIKQNARSATCMIGIRGRRASTTSVAFWFKVRDHAGVNVPTQRILANGNVPAWLKCITGDISLRDSCAEVESVQVLGHRNTRAAHTRDSVSVRVSSVNVRVSVGMPELSRPPLCPCARYGPPPKYRGTVYEGN